MNASVNAISAASKLTAYPEERLAAEIERALLAGESVEVASAFRRSCFAPLASVRLNLTDFEESGFDELSEWVETLVDRRIEFLKADSRAFSAAA